MSVTADKIINDLKKGAFHPVYWLQGDESFFIDQVTDFAEHHLLPASEAEFNLTVFYGRDSSWQDVINACRRYPMFAERQVVLIKEAADRKRQREQPGCALSGNHFHHHFFHQLRVARAGVAHTNAAQVVVVQ